MRILIVDDDEIALAMLGNALTGVRPGTIGGRPRPTDAPRWNRWCAAPRGW